MSNLVRVAILVVMVLVVVALVVVIITPEPLDNMAARYFRYYDAAFDYCMASEQYSREECLTVALGMNQR